MSEQKYAFGDRVRHPAKPEWGVGTVVKVEQLPMNGQASQRLSVRFPNAGVKTLVSGHADLERVTDNHDPFAEPDGPSVQAWDKLNESGWLNPLAKRKVEEAMISLPAEVRDAFNSVQKRLTLMLSLYRFDRTSHGLIDWAVAQTGLDDPLSRFTRQELEQHFDRWAYERETHLAKLLQEARNDQAALAVALKTAPPPAQDAVRRLIGSR